jgi:hypothetical protein
MVRDYFYEWGGLSRYRNADSDNPILFLAYYISLLGKAKIPEWIAFEVKPGLLKRAPDRLDDSNSWDEYLGWAYLSKQVAQDICAYGLENGWYFDNIKDNGWRFSYWRQPSQRFYLTVCAGFIPDILDKAWFYAAMIICMFHGKKRTSEILTQRLMNLCIPENPLTKLFDFVIDKKFGGWINVWKEYFNNENEHPILKQANIYYSSKLLHR